MLAPPPHLCDHSDVSHLGLVVSSPLKAARSPLLRPLSASCLTFWPGRVALLVLLAGVFWGKELDQGYQTGCFVYMLKTDTDGLHLFLLNPHEGLFGLSYASTNKNVLPG